MIINFSGGESVKTNSIQNYSLEYDQFVESLKEFKAVESKTDLQYFCGGQYKDGVRDEDHLISRTLIVLDVDEYNGTMDDLEFDLNLAIGEYRYICYSTFNHTFKSPRIRLILFPTQEIVLKHYRALIKFLANLVPCILDSCSYSASYAFFKGGYDDRKAYSPYFLENKGKLIDVEVIISKFTEDDLQTESEKAASESSIADDNFKIPLQLTFEEVQKYVMHYTPENLSYDYWYKTGMMIHHQTLGNPSGRFLWKAWSEKHFKQDGNGKIYTAKDYEDDTKNKWKSFSTNNKETLTFKAIKSAVDKTFPEISRNLKVNNKIYSFDEKIDIPFPDLKERGAKQITENNIKFLCKFYGFNVQYNYITNGLNITNYYNESFNKYQLPNKVARILDLCSKNNLSINKSDLNEKLNLMSEENVYNPILEFIKSKPWDGISRLEAMYNTVPSDVSNKKLLMRKWFLSAVAAVNEESFRNKGVLVFQSGQSRRKGDWFKSLLPKDLANAYLSEGITFCANNKDSLMSVSKNWICELGEIDATFKKSDMSALKSFISNDKDDIRLPYDRSMSTFKRHTIFYGTVNDEQFLTDDENVRWWVISLRDNESLNPDHNIDMQQFWSEIQFIYESGEPWYLIRDEIEELEVNNRHHKQLSTKDEILFKIQDTYDFENINSSELNKKTASQVYAEINKDGSLPNPSDKMFCNTGRALSKLKVVKSNNHWLMPKMKPVNIFNNSTQG